MSFALTTQAGVIAGHYNGFVSTEFTFFFSSLTGANTPLAVPGRARSRNRRWPPLACTVQIRNRPDASKRSESQPVSDAGEFKRTRLRRSLDSHRKSTTNFGANVAPNVQHAIVKKVRREALHNHRIFYCYGIAVS
jgi:hypothetical protein